MSNDLLYRLGLRILSRLPSQGADASDAANASGHVVVITSARDGEGKTFVAQALARALVAQCRGPVALVSCRPAHPAAPVRKGWSDLVDSGQWNEDAMAQRAEAGGLTTVDAGSSVRPETLFRPDHVQGALAALRQRFALTLIDAPSLAGCGVLLQQADGVVLVVDAAATRREVVQGALADNPVPADRMLGAVLNQRPEYVPSWLYRWML